MSGSSRARLGHARARFAMVCAVALVAMSMSSCPRTRSLRRPDTGARAFRIDDSTQLLPGVSASGRVGDYRLDNGKVAIVVNALHNDLGFALSGGNLIDAARIDHAGAADGLRQMFLYLDDTFPRQAIYDRLEVADSEGPEAVLVAHGTDSLAPDIAIRHEYRLAAGATHVVLRTTFTNRGAAAIADYELGDVIQWGTAERFAPGHGFGGGGRLSMPWVAGVAPGVTYGYTAATGTLGGPHGTRWSDPIVATVTLEPAEPVTFERFLIIGDGGGAATVMPAILTLRNERHPLVTGMVADVDRRTLARAVVTVATPAGEPIAMAFTDARGEFRIPVPVGACDMTAHMVGRGSHLERAVDVRDHGASVRFLLPSASGVRVTVRERAGGSLRPTPAKITIVGIDGTPDPHLGPPFDAAGAINVVLTADGEARVPLNPGTYRVYASRGLEWTLGEQHLTVEPGAEATVALEIERVVDTTGYLAGDFHQHALPSGDAAVSLHDRVLANLAEGVEIMAGTDHNEVTDYRPVLRQMGVTAVYPVLGVEATSETTGHFGAFPVPIAPAAARNGAPPVVGADAATIVRRLRRYAPDAVLQLNHPRAGRNGYFDIVGFDPAPPGAPPPGAPPPGAPPPGAPPPGAPAIELGFDAIELINGRRLHRGDQTRALLADWFWLLDHGHVLTAMGNSDSHLIKGEETGFGRTYLGVGIDDPARLTPAMITDAIARRRDAVATNGPFIRVEAGGASAIGATLRARPGERVSIEITVQAAPWVDVSTVELVRDGVVVGEPIAIATDRSEVVRYRATHELPVSERRSWVVVIARGASTLEPVVSLPPDGAITPLAIANPVWIEPGAPGEPTP